MKMPGRYYKFYPSKESPLGYSFEDLDLDPSKTALLIIDVYGKGFERDTRDESQLPDIYKPDAVSDRIVKDLIPRVKESAKKSGMQVVYLTNYLSPALSGGNEWRKMSMRTLDVDVLEAWVEPNEILQHSQIIAPEGTDILIEKQMYSGFFETCLESALRNLQISNLVMVGFDASICLKYTAVDALYRNYRLVVLRDCIRTSEYPETADGEWANFLAIRHIETALGYTATSDDFIVACGKEF